VTPIRPNAFPPPTPASAGADIARQAAQRAFFAAAAGRGAAPAGAQATTATHAPTFTPAATPVFVQRAELRPDASAEPPAKLLRPGSLLDIRV